MTGPALVVEDLTVRVGSLPAVTSLSFTLPAGTRTGLIGESGSGKTLTALALMGLLPDGITASGRVQYRALDLLGLPERDLCRLRGDRLAMVFQEPMTALNPVMQIGAQVAEPLRVHRGLARGAALTAARELLEHVHLPDAAEKLHSYPHQLSGGQRQRAMIAMAMACTPDILIADEPTTALDVTVQAQILNLLGGLVDEGGATLLLITHDLPVVANVCERVLVLYGGRLVEEGNVSDVFGAPRHPYTRALLDAIPPLDPLTVSRKLPAIPGVVPGLGQFPAGCPFRTRCPRADQACTTMPPLTGTAHRAACWHPLEQVTGIPRSQPVADQQLPTDSATAAEALESHGQSENPQPDPPATHDFTILAPTLESHERSQKPQIETPAAHDSATVAPASEGHVRSQELQPEPLGTHDSATVAPTLESHGQSQEPQPETPAAHHSASSAPALESPGRLEGHLQTPPIAADRPLVFTVEHAARHYRLPRTRLFGPRRVIAAVDDVSFVLAREETLGVVGESGSGKTTLMKLMLGLERPDAGAVTYHGADLHREVQVVFQDPASALDPRMRVEDIVREPLRALHIGGNHTERVRELLDAVGLTTDAARRYPHEFSGGQRQRIAIARALAPRPKVLIGDEPVSALDVSVRAQILNLLEDLRVDFQLTLVLVSHDLSVVRHMTDQVLVMQHGRIVEHGPTREVFAQPTHPYTRLLLDSIPRLPAQAESRR